MADERREQSYRLPYIDQVSRFDVSFDHFGTSGPDRAGSSACSQKRQRVPQAGEINDDQNAGLPSVSRSRGATGSTYSEYSIGSNESRFEENTDTQSLPSDYSGRNIQRRNLGFTQMTALMINSVIGSGIFTAPGYVLALTKCKRTALILWSVGGVYTGLCMLLYLEFGTALPFNGGALIYLDEVFYTPRLLATVLFSFHRILLASTSGNSRTLAIYLLALANPHVPAAHLPVDQIKIVAILIQSLACLILYFLRRTCFVTNGMFALFKIGAICILSIAGLKLGSGHYEGQADFRTKMPEYSAIGALSGMTQIIYTYQGFENVNCVAGEFKRFREKWKWATVVSLILIIPTYMLIAFAYYYVLDYETITSEAGQGDIGVVYAEKVFGSSTSLRIVASLSIFSNLIFEAYITARVKQAIAFQRIIPFYEFFSYQNEHLESPGGALFLHWTFSIIPLAVFGTNADERQFAAGIYSYGYQVVNFFLAIGLLRLPGRLRAGDGDRELTYLKNKPLRYIISCVFAGFNLITLYTTARPADPGTIPRKYWPVSVAAAAGVGFIYWMFFPLLRLRIAPEGNSLGEYLGFKVRYDNENEVIDPDLDNERREALKDVNKRRVGYELSGRLARVVCQYKLLVRWVYNNLGYSN